MDQIDKLLERINGAIRDNIEGDSLGYIDWQQLSEQEKEKFKKEFEEDGEIDSDGSGSFMKTVNDRDFFVNIINFT